MKNQIIFAFALLGVLLLVGTVSKPTNPPGPFYVLSTAMQSSYLCGTGTWHNQNTFVPTVQNTGSAIVGLYGVQINGVTYGFCEAGQEAGTVTFNPSQVKTLYLFDIQQQNPCSYPGQVLTPLVTYQYKSPSGIGSQTIRSTFVCPSSVGSKPA